MIVKVFDEFVTDAKNIREKVFIDEQGFSYDYDEFDDIAVHMVLYNDGEPIGACRIFEQEEKGVFFFGRLAVKKECRKNGAGSKLVEAAKEYAFSHGATRVILHAQLQARDFYLKLGFVEYGEIEYEEDCPHIWMKFDKQSVF